MKAVVNIYKFTTKQLMAKKEGRQQLPPLNANSDKLILKTIKYLINKTTQN